MEIRRAKIKNINKSDNTATIEYTAGYDIVVKNVKLPMPYAGQGYGIHVGYDVDDIVLVGEDLNKEVYILCTLQDDRLLPILTYKDVEQLDVIYNNKPRYYPIDTGEILLQCKELSNILLDKYGSITLQTPSSSLISIDNINELILISSLNQIINSESGVINFGLIRRDIRTKQEKLEDFVTDNIISNNPESFLKKYIIGVDPKYFNGEHYGLFDLDSDIPPFIKNKVNGLYNIPNSDKIIDNIKNPALNELSILINEFSDGVNLINKEFDYTNKRRGYLDPNLMAKFILGTVVDEKGRIPRFDYVFGDFEQNKKRKGIGKGHGRIWILPGINENNNSVDFKYDKDRNVNSKDIELNDTHRWEVTDISKFNASIGLELVLNTRGADNNGVVVDDKNIGSKYYIGIDKEGLTKINIPAATSLNEKYRSGRSLLFNSDGSITLSIGKEYGRDFNEKSVVVGYYDKNYSEFYNKNAKYASRQENNNKNDIFLNYNRDRENHSITADLEGAVELRVGKKSTGESIMLECDGGFSFYLGKLNNEGNSVAIPDDILLSKPNKNSKRKGYSLQGRLDGALELDIGKSDGDQSISLNASSVAKLSINQDNIGNSLNIDASGSVSIDVKSGGHRFLIASSSLKNQLANSIVLQHGGPTKSIIMIDPSGKIILRNSVANSQIIIDNNGNITMINSTGANVNITSTGIIECNNGLSRFRLDPTNGVTLSAGSNLFQVSLSGNIDIITSGAVNISASSINLNTSYLKSGSLPNSPYNMVVSDNIIPSDPLTGHYNLVMPTTKIG